MKIISKFQDYYDGVQAYGRDESLVYIRHTEELDTKGFDFSEIHVSAPRKPDFGFGFYANLIYIGFCGKLFTVYDNGVAGRRRYSPRMCRESLDNFFNETQGKKIKDDLFFQLNTPVFLVKKARHSNDWVLVKDPCLKDYGFPSLLDPFTAFQEISMYLGGVLGVGTPKMVEIKDDKIMAAKKGFDEWSFRSPSPGQKKRKQKQQ